ncbi:MAG TPA: DUF975 family protein [Candidatus Paceibacterota bacterium]|nr:DUF975 family protein [Candidatus Paceibacterota bacterium]
MQTLTVKDPLSFGWNKFKSRPWLFVQAGLVLLLANIAVSVVQSLFEAGSEVGEGTILVLGSLLSMIFGIAASMLMSMGETAFFLRAHDSVQDTSLRMLWHPHPFWKFVAATLLAGVLIFLGLILLIVPGIILGILFMFVGYLVIDKNLEPIDALKQSWAMTKGSRWTLFFLGLALLGLNILGFIALIVGLFVTIPVSFLATVHAYRVLSKSEAVQETVLVPETV